MRLFLSLEHRPSYERRFFSSPVDPVAGDTSRHPFFHVRFERCENSAVCLLLSLGSFYFVPFVVCIEKDLRGFSVRDVFGSSLECCAWNTFVRLFDLGIILENRFERVLLFISDVGYVSDTCAPIVHIE